MRAYHFVCQISSLRAKKDVCENDMDADWLMLVTWLSTQMYGMPQLQKLQFFESVVFHFFRFGIFFGDEFSS